MRGIRSIIGGDDEAEFTDEDSFDPEHIPEPGSFLLGHDVLDGRRHVEFHRLTAEIFEERGVYDMTFGYNLAKLNRDTRHSDAGYRYAVDAEDPSVLRAEFSPTTEFCPQSDTLTKGSFRAWNALSDRHGYDLVRVRVAETHQQSEAVNEALAEMERQYEETGEIDAVETDAEVPEPTVERGTDPEAPF
ncbi:hypothetical protein [Halovenus carboxidivorans]|uniref:hypothetical protein n=1 Tax=Halovenus carboxidivorans TaxID=2692199 RepID=UPI001915CFDF|nr:hypothetical protein [Halovenus carboxidivorans]